MVGAKIMFCFAACAAAVSANCTTSGGADEAWITLMSNRNIVAVATLADTACIVLAEGVVPDEGVAQLATDKGVNILQSPKSAYEIALALRDAL